MTTFLVIPVVAKMSKTLGKKRAFVVSQGISIIGYILLWFLLIPGKPYMFIFALPFFAFGIGSLFTLMMSMTADVIDLDEINTGKRREGIFGAIYWWMVKLGQALALVLGGLVLKVVGFDGNAAVQTAETIRDLRIADIVIPAVTAGLAIFVMWKYSLNETRAEEIKQILIERRGEL